MSASSLLFAFACGGAATVPDTAPVEATAETTPTEPSLDARHGLNAGVVSFDVDGIDVIVKPTPANRIVSVTVFVNGGTAMNAPLGPGAVDLALHAMTSGGPASLDRATYQAQLDAIGSSISAVAGYDYDTFGMSSVAPAFDNTWALFVDVLRNPAFRAEDVELEREQLIASLVAEADDPDRALTQLGRQVIYAGHPYAVRPEGTPEALAEHAVESLQHAAQTLLSRNRLSIVVVGDVDPLDIEQRVRTAFGDLPAGVSRGFDVPEIVVESPMVEVTERADLPTNYILGYFPTPGPGEPDYAASQLALALLSDRLFEEVRTRRNLSYAVSAGIGARRANVGYLYVTATDPATTVDVMLDTVQALVDVPVDEAELNAQRAIDLTQYYMSIEANASLGGALGQWELVGGGRENADAHIAALQAVTPEDVVRVMDAYVRNIQWVVVGDPAEAPEATFTAR
jgi:zinc protease